MPSLAAACACRQFVVRALLRARDNETMLHFALPAAYNLSSESGMLHALDVAEVRRPPARALAAT
eukprot:4401388-Prymnesium_polylepis.1